MQPDWVYKELKWWTQRRDAAPIVVDTTGEGERWLPELLTNKWPDINRIDLNRDEADNADRSHDQKYTGRVRDRIVGAIRQLEHRTI